MKTSLKNLKKKCNKTGTTEEALANADKIGFNTNLFVRTSIYFKGKKFQYILQTLF